MHIKPDKHETFNSLGFLYLKTGDLINAETHLVKSIAFGSNDFGNMNLGHVYLCKGEEEKAILCYQKGLSHIDNSDDFWAGMKDDYAYLVQYGISEGYYQTILEKIRDNAPPQ
jgi:tetratricopeptide (TPR) repeat protein